jgi:hypothetical protein
MVKGPLGGRQRREVHMRPRSAKRSATTFSAPLLSGVMTAAVVLAPLTDASAYTPPPRPVVVQRPVVVPRVNVQRPNVQRNFVQHNAVQPNAVQRVPFNARPVNPNPNFNPNVNPNVYRNPGLNQNVFRNPGLIPNRGNPQQFNQPFNNQQRVMPVGPGGPAHNAVVGGAVNGLRLGPGGPNSSTSVRLGPGGFPVRPSFPVITAHNRFFPIVRGPRFVWWGGYRRTFIPLAALGVVLIGGAYWYPDGYVSVAQPLCTGLTPDGCQLTWRNVDFEDGGGVPQCVQYCPQSGPPPATTKLAELPPAPPPAPANGTCEMTIFAEPNFGGLSAPTADNQPTLSQAGWLNEISSVQVQTGTWEFYADENFGGASMRLSPGQYPNLTPEWTKHIGSFQCVEPTA